MRRSVRALTLLLLLGCHRSDSEMERAAELRAAEAMWCGLGEDVASRFSGLVDAGAADSVLAPYTDSLTVLQRRCDKASAEANAFLQGDSTTE